MNLELKEDNGQKISWSQDLSVLDLAFWFDKTASDEAREIETVEDYKDMLEQNGWKDKNIAEVMDEKYDWDIITEVQKRMQMVHGRQLKKIQKLIRQKN